MSTDATGKRSRLRRIDGALSWPTPSARPRRVPHSRRPDAEVILYTRAEWEAFLKGVRNNEFDFFAG